ncbi:hypothetical protein [Geodermatophilus siccatus]|uniref:hypothetical protein n=1 Tax=Geodermatophilus siccatus TaxID=1137991 RepID=UPI001114549D|nr:hypothetical protein [Geodermatophilus siccatus]
MKVFDDISRSDPSPARHDESSADFYARVSGVFWDDIRTLIDDWFSRLCAGAKADIRSRLRSSNDRDLNSAFWELYLHESLVGSGFTVTCHPDVPEGTRKPDFLASNDQTSFYVEARAISPSDVDAVAGNRVKAVYGQLDKLDSPNFFLWIAVERSGSVTLATKKLRLALTSWLAPLDPDELLGVLDGGSAEALPTFTWDADGWRITFRAIPKSPGSRGTGTGVRPLGIFGGTRAQIVDDKTPIRTALSKKGKAYGDLGRPYIVALAISSLSSDGDDIADALYGTESFELVTTESGEVVGQPTWASDGYWWDGTSWLHTSVSGVLLARNMHPGRVGVEVPTLWLHPNPLRAVEGLPIWRTAAVVDGEVTFSPQSIDPPTLFGLPDPWPSGERFPADA